MPLIGTMRLLLMCVFILPSFYEKYVVFWIYRMYCISYFRLSGVLFKDPILLWMDGACTLI